MILLDFPRLLTGFRNRLNPHRGLKLGHKLEQIPGYGGEFRNRLNPHRGLKHSSGAEILQVVPRVRNRLNPHRGLKHRIKAIKIRRWRFSSESPESSSRIETLPSVVVNMQFDHVSESPESSSRIETIKSLCSLFMDPSSESPESSSRIET